tara:strand:+ start:183 stop:797 length:615 start_codon:yes stop_codon:yes gene_type:complete
MAAMAFMALVDGKSNPLTDGGSSASTFTIFHNRDKTACSNSCGVAVDAFVDDSLLSLMLHWCVCDEVDGWEAVLVCVTDFGTTSEGGDGASTRVVALFKSISQETGGRRRSSSTRVIGAKSVTQDWVQGPAGIDVEDNGGKKETLKLSCTVMILQPHQRYYYYVAHQSKAAAICLVKRQGVSPGFKLCSFSAAATFFTLMNVRS